MLWRRGYLAVDLFFLLSGFVLTHVYGSRFAGQLSWRGLRGFFWARFCRVYPTAIFVTAVYSLAYATGGLTFGTNTSFQTQLAAALLLMQVPWLSSIELNQVAWSISAELYGYMLFPLAAPFFLNIGRFSAAFIGIALLVAVVSVHMFFDPQTLGWGALVRALPEFMAGILAYRAYHAGLWKTVWAEGLHAYRNRSLDHSGQLDGSFGWGDRHSPACAVAGFGQQCGAAVCNPQRCTAAPARRYFLLGLHFPDDTVHARRSFREKSRGASVWRSMVRGHRRTIRGSRRIAGSPVRRCGGASSPAVVAGAGRGSQDSAPADCVAGHISRTWWRAD